jgi:hypothetical protein
MPSAILPRIQWVGAHTTNQILPIDIRDADGEQVTAFTVAVVLHDAGEPASGAYSAAQNDGDLWGPRINGLTRGLYLAYPKVGTEVLGPVPFKLT